VRAIETLYEETLREAGAW